MEGVPRMPMLGVELKQNSFDYSALDWAGMPTEDIHEATQQQIIDGLKKHIKEEYGDNPEKYTGAIEKLIEIQTSAYKAILSPDFEGCNTLKKYYGQLHYMQSRFPFSGEDQIKVTFTWQDAFTGILTVHESFSFEQTAILFNIGAIHSLLGEMDSRTTEEGIRISCVHFQCAAGLFTYISDHFDTTLSPDISQAMLKLFINVMLAQGQECLLEKSMQDNRKHSIVSKISQQVVEYYKQTQQCLENRESESTLGGNAYKHWKRIIAFKAAYYSAITKYYMGNNALDQDKYGQAVAFYGAAVKSLNESAKLSKNIQKETRLKIEEALKFTSDVLNGKYNSSVKDNNFVYNDKVPDASTLPEVKGASLVKPLPFEPANESLTGPDIFAKLVPMEAHLAASTYSDEKDKLLRKVNGDIDEKDETLKQYKQSIELDPKKLINYTETSKLDQALIEKCALLSVDQTPITQLKQATEELTEVYTELDSVLNNILSISEDEETEDIKLKDAAGKEAFSTQEDVEGIKKELTVYKEIYHKSSQMNEDLHTACRIHITNMKLITGGMDSLKEELSLTNIADLLTDEEKSDVESMRKLCDKVVEMEEQRQTLLRELKQGLESDDVTATLVTKHGIDQEALFQEELKKHDSIITTINQNLTAQDNILAAVTQANARYAKIRKTVETERERVDQKVGNLLLSCDVQEEVLSKCNEGKKFFVEILDKAKQLYDRAKEFHEENEAKRKAIYKKIEEREKAKHPPPRPSAPKPKLSPKKPAAMPKTLPATTVAPIGPGMVLSPDVLAKMMADDDDELLNDPEFLQFLQNQGDMQTMDYAASLPGSAAIPPSSGVSNAPSRPHSMPPTSYTPSNYPAVSSPHGVPGQVNYDHGNVQSRPTPQPTPPHVGTPYLQHPAVSSPHGADGHVNYAHGNVTSRPAPQSTPPHIGTPYQQHPVVSSPHGAQGHVNYDHGNVPPRPTPQPTPPHVGTPYQQSFTQRPHVGAPPQSFNNAGMADPRQSPRPAMVYSSQPGPGQTSQQQFQPPTGHPSQSQFHQQGMGTPNSVASAVYPNWQSNAQHGTFPSSMPQSMTSVSQTSQNMTPLLQSVAPTPQNMTPVPQSISAMPTHGMTFHGGQAMPPHTAPLHSGVPQEHIATMENVSSSSQFVQQPMIQSQVPQGVSLMPHQPPVPQSVAPRVQTPQAIYQTNYPAQQLPAAAPVQVSQVAIVYSAPPCQQSGVNTFSQPMTVAAMPQRMPLGAPQYSHSDSALHSGIPSMGYAAQPRSPAPQQNAQGMVASQPPVQPSQSYQSYAQFSNQAPSMAANPSISMSGHQQPIRPNQTPHSYQAPVLSQSVGPNTTMSMIGQMQPQGGPGQNTQAGQTNYGYQQSYQSQGLPNQAYPVGQQTVQRSQVGPVPNIAQSVANAPFSGLSQAQQVQASLSHPGPPTPNTPQQFNVPQQRYPSNPQNISVQQTPVQFQNATQSSLPSNTMAPPLQVSQGMTHHQEFPRPAQPGYGDQPTMPRPSSQLPNTSIYDQRMPNPSAQQPLNAPRMPHPPAQQIPNSVSHFQGQQGATLHQARQTYPQGSSQQIFYGGQVSGSQAQNQLPPNQGAVPQNPSMGGQGFLSNQVQRPPQTSQYDALRPQQQSGLQSQQASISNNVSQQQVNNPQMQQSSMSPNIVPQQNFGKAQDTIHSQQSLRSQANANIPQRAAQSLPSQYSGNVTGPHGPPQIPVTASEPSQPNMPRLQADGVSPSQGNYTFKSHPHPGQYLSTPSNESSPKHAPPQRSRNTSFEAPPQPDILTPTPVNEPKPVPTLLKQPSSDLAGLILTPTRTLSSSADELLFTSPDQGTMPARTNNQIMLVPTKIDEESDKMVVRPIEGIPYMDEADLMKFKGEVTDLRSKVSNLLHKPESNGLCELDREWKQLSETQEKYSRQLSTAIARCSSYKNRYQDIVPFDQSRVVLKNSKDDYINASVIDGVSPYCPRFVATQSPLPNTTSDFWLMVYEQQVTLIVMLVNSKDVPKKCPMYWPADRTVPQQHGPLTVAFTTSKTHGDLYIERTFTIKHKNQSLAMSVTQLQYIAWPEHRLPLSASDLLSFLTIVQSYHSSQRNLQWPVLVHCESGVGRTGVFCAFLAGVSEINAGMGIMDVIDIVTKMRQKRKYMVQEKAQLKFVYDVVLYHAIDVLKQRRVVLIDEAKPTSAPQQAHQHQPPPFQTPSQFDIFSDQSALFSIQATVEKMTVKQEAEKMQQPTTLSSKSFSEIPVSNDKTMYHQVSVRPNTSEMFSTQLWDATHQPQTSNSGSGGGLSDLVQGTITAPVLHETPPAKNESVPQMVVSKPDVVESCNTQNEAQKFTPISKEPEKSNSPVALIESLTPETFTLATEEDASRKPRVTKEDFFKPRTGFNTEKDPSDPFSGLDPLWGLKK